MRKLNALLFFSLVLLLQTGIANAVFDNSHHDMRGYIGPGSESRNCFHCHGRVSLVTTSPTDNNWGAVGALCLARCHQGTGSLLGDVNSLMPQTAPSVNPLTYGVTVPAKDVTMVYFPNSHGRNPQNLRDGAGTQVAWPPTPNPNWPYVMGTGPTARQLECTSCHSVHDNQFPPFLWAPQYSAGTRNGFCDQCHVERATQDLSIAPNGMHPVDFVVSVANATGRTGSNRHGRRINIQTYSSTNVFDVANVAGSALIGVGGTASWNTGGHMTSTAAGAMTAWDNTQQMGCYTCHAAHRNNVNGESNLVVVATADQANGWDPICVGCHGSATTNALDRAEWNMGTTNFGHPVGSTTGVVSGTHTLGGQNTYRDSMNLFASFQVTARAAVSPSTNQWGNNGQLMCITCHKVHYGTTNSMALANLGQGSGGTAICKQCHNGVGFANLNDLSKAGIGETANTHHRTATSVTAGTQGTPSSHTPANEAQTLNMQNPSWANATTGLGVIGGSSMDCADCHTFPSAGGTAHNW